ncbi:hypothetical protein J6590_043826 [Homalodisca vitripennis]|nr:hypothetical protein J6590_043826 [Homalodisca vitripennis]
MLEGNLRLITDRSNSPHDMCEHVRTSSLMKQVSVMTKVGPLKALASCSHRTQTKRVVSDNSVARRYQTYVSLGILHLRGSLASIFKHLCN